MAASRCMPQWLLLNYRPACSLFFSCSQVKEGEGRGGQPGLQHGMHAQPVSDRLPTQHGALRCAAPRRTALRRAALRCAAPHCAVLCCAILRFAAPCPLLLHAVLCHAVPCCDVLRHAVPAMPHTHALQATRTC